MGGGWLIEREAVGSATHKAAHGAQDRSRFVSRELEPLSVSD